MLLRGALAEAAADERRLSATITEPKTAAKQRRLRNQMLLLAEPKSLPSQNKLLNCLIIKLFDFHLFNCLICGKSWGLHRREFCLVHLGGRNDPNRIGSQPFLVPQPSLVFATVFAAVLATVYVCF